MSSPLARCQKQDGIKDAVVADSSRMVNEYVFFFILVLGILPTYLKLFNTPY